MRQNPRIRDSIKLTNLRSSFVVCWLMVILQTGSSQFTFGQTTAVLTGNVTDATTGKPLPFAHVYLNGSTHGAVTDKNGSYTLTGLPLGLVEIAASYVGYKPASQKVRFENSSSQKADFQLQESEQMLEAVTIRGHSKQLERHLREFKRKLFGERFDGQCELVNSEALRFREDKEHLYATAKEPLIINNKALGYRIFYDLQHFDATPSGKIYSAGTARFEELKPENERQANRFRRNRLTAYSGSIRHLMASLIDNTFEQAGFMVYQEDFSRRIPADRRIITLDAVVSDYKRLVPVQVSELIQPGKLANERRLVSSMKLIIFYTKATSNYSPYPDARHAYTEIRLPRGQMQMTVDGVITLPEGMEAEGSMGNDGLATLLPADWKPEAGNKTEPLETTLLASQGKLAPPDTSMGSISAAFKSRFKVMAPSLFVHIDKPFYATGDRLWLSTYLLDATSHEQIRGETAIHVDLLTPTGKLVQHQWIRIADGRGQGSFRLSDTLETGRYRLRAYTDEDGYQRRPAFERSVAVSNLFRNQSSAFKDSVLQQLDIQVLPEGGRWIAGLPVRLGIKIVQADGRGLSAPGRIVDDSGLELTRFRSNQQGITSVVVTPKAGRTYSAEVALDNRLQRVPLPATENEGLTLSADAISDTTRLVLSILSSNQAAADPVYLMIQQRGLLVDQRKIFLQKGAATISLPITSWLPGIAQVTLYDSKAKPQCERLFFVPQFTAPVAVVSKFSKTRYQPREEAILRIDVNDAGSSVPASLSVSITDANKVPEDTVDATMPVHLLLTGELRGYVQNANQYLVNNSPEARRALDDLLLTQGWRRVSGTPESDSLGGVSLSGRIVNSKYQPISGAKIILMSTKPGQSFVKSAEADEQGRFRIAGMDVADTLQLILQTAGRNSGKIAAKEIILVPEGPGRQWELGNMVAMPNLGIPQTQLTAARIRQETNSDFYRDKTVQLLDEVTIRTLKQPERPRDIQLRSLHNAADAVITFHENSPNYQNLYEMIQGQFTGVTVTRTVARPGGAPKSPGYMVSVRGMNSHNSGTQPLFLMDGVPIHDPDGTVLMNFSSRDIERIELLKSAGTAGMYGVMGSNGVIAFYTKNARSMSGNAKPEESLNKLIEFTGYPSVQREFYVPRYDTIPTADSNSAAVDDRDVLFWKPIIQTDNKGKGELRFPLSDAVQSLRVVIQGITADGRPLQSVQVMRVQ